MMRAPAQGLAILIVLLLAATACRAGSTLADDVARAATRSGTSSTRLGSALDDAARASTRSADELADFVAASAAADNAYTAAWNRARNADLADGVAKGVLCDTLKDAALSPDQLSVESLAESIAINLVTSLGGEVVEWLALADEIAEDLADGTANNRLWGRTMTMKLRHC